MPRYVFALPTGVMPPILSAYPSFGTGPALHTTCSSDLKSRRHALFCPRAAQPQLRATPGFSIPTFAIFDGSSDPYDHMLHYNQEMTLNPDNDHLLCKVFPASLQGPALAWFHKLPCNLINSFNTLWTIFM